MLRAFLAEGTSSVVLTGEVSGAGRFGGLESRRLLPPTLPRLWTWLWVRRVPLTPSSPNSSSLNRNPKSACRSTSSCPPPGHQGGRCECLEQPPGQDPPWSVWSEWVAVELTIVHDSSAGRCLIDVKFEHRVASAVSNGNCTTIMGTASNQIHYPWPPWP